MFHRGGLAIDVRLLSGTFAETERWDADSVGGTLEPKENVG